MVLNRILYAFLLIASLILMLSDPQTVYILLFIAAVLMPVFSLLICIRQNRKTLFGFKMPATVEKNAPCPVKLGIRSGTVFPIPKLSVRASLLNHTTGYSTRAQVVCFADPKTNDRLVWPFKSKYCGLVEFKVDELTIYDFFGIFRMRRKNCFSENVTVLPAFRRELSVSENTAVRTLVDSVEYSQTKKGLDNSEIFSIKEYGEGDSTRAIHWKLSSKSDTLYVKEFSEPVNSFVCLVIESLSSVGDDKAGSETLDRLFESFFSFSQVLLQEGISHTITWFDPESDMLREREIQSNDDLLFAMNDVLSAAPHVNEPVALKHRREVVNENTAGHTVYFTPYVFSDELRSFATLGALTVINCGKPAQTEKSELAGVDLIDLYDERIGGEDVEA